MKKLTFSQRMAVRSFQKDRSEFYGDLSSLLKSTEKNLVPIFESDIDRYAGQSRAVVASIWVQRLEENGADLADAWQGTLPDDEVAVMFIQQVGGKEAIADALGDMARMSKLTELVFAETKKTVGAAVVALLIGIGAVTVFPIVAVGQLKDALQMPVSAWGSAGRAMAYWSETVQTWGIPLAIMLAFLLFLVSWSIKNWTGQTREWADLNITLYKTVRDLYSVRFLDTMSTLARKRENIMQTLDVALDHMVERTPSAWSRWRLTQVLSEIEKTGATTCNVFDTGILSKQMFWRLRDIEESRGFSSAFELTSQYVSEHLVPRLIKRLVVWRWVTLFTAVGMAAAMVLWMQLTTGELKNAIVNYMGN